LMLAEQSGMSRGRDRRRPIDSSLLTGKLSRGGPQHPTGRGEILARRLARPLHCYPRLRASVASGMIAACFDCPGASSGVVTFRWPSGRGGNPRARGLSGERRPIVATVTVSTFEEATREQNVDRFVSLDALMNVLVRLLKIDAGLESEIGEPWNTFIADDLHVGKLAKESDQVETDDDLAHKLWPPEAGELDHQARVCPCGLSRFVAGRSPLASSSRFTGAASSRGRR
jgi:hypothetical protein